MTKPRTLEQRIKFDYGLPMGQSLVRFTLGERSVDALVEIGKRGEVYYFVKPDAGTMYASWQRVTGDITKSGSGAIKLWAEKDAEFMARFSGNPAATIPIK